MIRFWAIRTADNALIEVFLEASGALFVVLDLELLIYYFIIE